MELIDLQTDLITITSEPKNQHFLYLIADSQTKAKDVYDKLGMNVQLSIMPNENYFIVSIYLADTSQKLKDIKLPKTEATKMYSEWFSKGEITAMGVGYYPNKDGLHQFGQLKQLSVMLP